MDTPNDTAKQSYGSLYQDFDSPLMQQLRREAYGEDIGQHSWVTADELRADIRRLALSSQSRLLDLGCGPCGPLTFIMQTAGCSGTGMDLSAEALAAGQRRAVSMKLDQRFTTQAVNLDSPIPLPGASFDAVISVDVMLHLRDRKRALAEIARVLVPRGRVLFTDAGVVTGSVTNEEVAARSMHGFTHFTAPGHNEKLLELAGFRLIETENRTAGMLTNASGRFKARLAHRAEIEAAEGAQRYLRYQDYLRSIVTMAERGALSRIMFLAKTGA